MFKCKKKEKEIDFETFIKHNIYTSRVAIILSPNPGKINISTQ